MQISLITKEQMYARVDKPYNAPLAANELAEDQFRTEFFDTQSQIDDCLRLFGENDFRGDADYCLCSDWGLSRGIGITVTSAGFVTAQLLDALYKTVQDITPEYELFVTNFEKAIPWEGIFINQQGCLVCADSLDCIPGFT